MQIWAGLGNPGQQYAMHRHNVGFMAVDLIADMYRFSPPKKQFQGWVQEGRIGPEKIILLKPATFMNESGRAIGEAMRFYKLTPQDVTVFHDELDLAPMKVKVKRGGGNAGHNGLRSTDAHIGNDFRRVRLGIGHPGEKELVMPHVLGDFHKAEQPWLDAMLQACADALPFAIAGLVGTALLGLLLLSVTGSTARVAKRVEEATQRLRDSEERFRTIVEHAPIGVVSADLNARPQEINPYFCHLLGFSMEQLKARSILAITHPDDRAEDSRLGMALIRGELGRYSRIKRYVGAQGQVVTVRSTVSLLRDDHDISPWFETAYEEVAAVGRAAGVALPHTTTVASSLTSVTRAVAEATGTPARSNLRAQPTLFSSSKRAFNSTKAVTCLPFSAA
mgnify:CR=1 FL=1